MTKNLSYFMKPENKEKRIMEFPAPERFKDENGERVVLKIRSLSASEIAEINKMYTQRTVACDKRGNPFIKNGEVAYKVEKDSVKASRHMIVEALVEPNLKDKELMEYYDCYDFDEMPDKVFSTFDEFDYVQNCVMKASGMIEGPDENSNDVSEAKN